MGLVTAKLRETAAHVIAMSVLVLNLRKIQRTLLRMLTYLLEILAQNKNWALVQWTLIILFFAHSTVSRIPCSNVYFCTKPVSAVRLETSTSRCIT